MLSKRPKNQDFDSKDVFKELFSLFTQEELEVLKTEDDLNVVENLYSASSTFIPIYSFEESKKVSEKLVKLIRENGWLKTHDRNLNIEFFIIHALFYRK